MVGRHGFVFCLATVLLDHSCHSSVFCLCPGHQIQPQHVLITQAVMLILLLCSSGLWRKHATYSFRLLRSAVSSRLHSWHPSLLFSLLFFLQSDLPTFRYFNVWIFQICLCVDQGIFCWNTHVQLVTLRGETREPLTLPCFWSHSVSPLIWKFAFDFISGCFSGFWNHNLNIFNISGIFYSFSI